ncbi:integrin alpha-L-like isoform X2 [Bufo bufo]|uniref:integrin alpha-L-like isoform X2 n=1 Tax=Bufo bufo TaxID=8384 RepID=UPI001ABEE7F3|nr:integrin alpha-L-like isoform X2 [Bufo bufo]
MACWWLLLLLSLLEEANISFTFNVEVSEYRRFSSEVSSLFGYKVVQFNSTSGQRLLIGDPGSNILCACDIRNNCVNITLPDIDSTSHLGLTLEVDPMSNRCLVCGSAIPHNCFETQYTNGACYIVDSSLTVSSKSTPGFEECQNVDVDLCFLIDDSHSVGELEFGEVQKFLLNTIQNLKSSTVHFSVVMFSTIPKTVLNFTDYQLGKAEEKIKEMKHIGGFGYLYRALKFTLNEIFTPEAGARQHAKKVLLLLTDGDVNDNNNGTTEAADKLKVTRYVIGVGNNFKAGDITELPSNPKEHHIHEIGDFSQLEAIFKEMQTKILAIEGVAQGSDFTREMSSAGLSAFFTQDRSFLGDPGIFDWSGGILGISEQEELIYMSTKEEDKYGYMGYSVKMLHTGKGLFCVVGSPRHQYIGRVTVLQEVAGENKWKNIDTLLGQQVGSYFGAEIAVSDLNQDGVTDLVLISAPHHSEPKWSGQVSVCRFTEKLECTVTLRGEPGHLQSQFGAAVSSLGDLDGDNITEVAVGAPYEMDGRGALYIYKGGSAGLSPLYSQRLLSPPGILGFGLSFHGVLDMTEDGLVDVVVGSRGHVTLHRSQPVLKVSVSVTSNQTYLLVSSPEANGSNRNLTLQACVHGHILTPKYTGSVSVSIRYRLVLDHHKPESRMLFTNRQREMNGTVEIQGPGAQCHMYTIFLQDCHMEDVSELQVSLTAFPEHVDSPWLLAPSSNLSATGQISFKMCEGEENCEPDTSIKLRCSQLVVQDGASFSIFLSLHNMSLKACHTRLSVDLPDGLRFHKANVIEASHRISLVCEDFTEQVLTCNVTHPSLRRGVWAIIQITFSIVSNVSWAEHILLAVNVTSDGNETSSFTEEEVPVLYPIHIISRSLEDSTKHMAFSGPETSAAASHRYQIQNLRVSAVAINVSVSMWTEGVNWDFVILSSQNSNVTCPELHKSSANQTHSEKTETLANQTWSCILDASGEISINITGLLKPTNTWKVASSVKVRSAVTVQYNQLRYHSDTGNMYHTAQVVTEVEILVLPDYTEYFVGGAVGGIIMMALISFLLYKCGFFKRYKDRMMEDVPSSDTQRLTSPKRETAEVSARLMEPQKPLTSNVQ